MSIKRLISCDYCGTSVPDTYEGHFRACFVLAATEPDIDACSREHLGFAIAKAFGIPIDGNLGLRLEEKTRECMAAVSKSDGRGEDIRRMQQEIDERSNAERELEKQIVALNRALDEKSKLVGTDRMEATAAILENGRLQSRIAELTAPVVVDGKTPGQVAHEGFHEEWAKPKKFREDTPFPQQSLEVRKNWEAAAAAVIRAFGPQSAADTYQSSYAELAYEAWQNLPATPKETKLWGMLKGAERNEWRAIVGPVVERVRAETNEWAAAEGLRRVQEKLTYDDDPSGYFRGIIAAEIASITDTTKPTKPSQAIDNCEAYIEARMEYRRIKGGTFAEMHTFWRDNVDDFRRDERLIAANGDIIESMDQ